MTTRRVVEHKGKTLENEELTIVTIFEESISKEQLKKMNGYSKQHQVLIRRGHLFEFKQEKA